MRKGLNERGRDAARVQEYFPTILNIMVSIISSGITYIQFGRTQNARPNVRLLLHNNLISKFC